MRVQPITLLLAFAVCPFMASKAQTIANAGPDQGICLDTTSMQANTPLPTEIGLWTLTSGSATIIDPTDPTTFITGIAYGQSVLTWTIITPVDTTYDQVRITRYFAEGVPIDAGPDQSITAPPFSTTMAGSPPFFPQVFTWSVIQGTGLFSDTHDPHATVSGLSEGVNIFQWTTGSGPCIITGMDQVVITVQLSTAQTIANAGPDQGICLDTTSMQANTPLPTEIGHWTLTSGTAAITDASDPMTTVTGIDYGQVLLTWTITTPVDSTSDQVNITRFWVDPAIQTAGPDQTIYAPPFSTTMGASHPTFPQVCTWSVIQGSGTFDDPNDPVTTVTGLGLGANIFYWTCDNSPCNEPGWDDVVVTVELGTSIGIDANNRPAAMWFDQSSGVLRIEGDVQANSLFIVNALGQAVTLRTKPSAGSLDLSDLRSGIYCATATISGTRRTLRFAVER